MTVDGSNLMQVGTAYHSKKNILFYKLHNLEDWLIFRNVMPVMKMTCPMLHMWLAG